jgi:hypothetical protein
MSDANDGSWIARGWVSTDQALIAGWKSQLEALSPDKVGFMRPQRGRPPAALDDEGDVPGVVILCRPDLALSPPAGLRTMSAAVAAALVSANFADGA